MFVSRSAPGLKSDIGKIEHAVSRIVTWATRNDVHQEAMRRAKCYLPRRHLWLLTRLDLHGASRVSDLAISLGVDGSTVTPQAQRLEREGYIVREADPTDRRASLLRVTRSGKALLTRVHTNRRAMFDELMADWAPEDKANAAEVLTKLAELLEANADDRASDAM